MTTQLRFLAVVLLTTGCPRPPEEPVAPPVQPSAEQSEPEVEGVDRIRSFEFGLGIATLTERGKLDFRGPPEYESWLAERGPIEAIWQNHGICVRTAEGVSCKKSDVEFRVEPPTKAEVIDVAWSFSSLCAATSDGALWCSFDVDPHTKPLRRFPVSNVLDVEAEGDFGCARLEFEVEDLGAVCWTGNGLDGGTALREFCKQSPDAPGCEGLEADQMIWPAPHDGFGRTRDIAAGLYYACVLADDGVVRCHDGSGTDMATLGNEFEAIRGMPPLVEIEGGLRHVCGRSLAGEVWCWGSNEFGQLGDGTTESLEELFPKRVVGDELPAAEWLAVRDFTSCLLAEEEIWCWGWLDETPKDPMPTEIPGIFARELEVAETSACALGGTNWTCWGGDTDTRGGVAAASEIVDVTRDVARKGDSGCVLLHRRVECPEWDGERIVIPIPTSTSLHGSLDYGCVLTKTGAVHCWDDEGPAVSIELPGKQVAVSVRYDQGCALDDAGSVRCWNVEEPPLLAGVADIVEVHGGLNIGCARDRSGTIACWGNHLVADPYAEMITLDEPVTIQLPAPAVEFGVGRGHGCARLDDGRVSCWGSEYHGERARLSAEFAIRPRKLENEKP
jgi:hypothetical protein